MYQPVDAELWRSADRTWSRTPSPGTCARIWKKKLNNRFPLSTSTYSAILLSTIYYRPLSNWNNCLKNQEVFICEIYIACRCSVNFQGSVGRRCETHSSQWSLWLSFTCSSMLPCCTFNPQWVQVWWFRIRVTSSIAAWRSITPCSPRVLEEYLLFILFLGMDGNVN